MRQLNVGLLLCCRSTRMLSRDVADAVNLLHFLPSEYRWLAFWIPMASQCGIHHRMIHNGTIISTISVITHTILSSCTPCYNPLPSSPHIEPAWPDSDRSCPSTAHQRHELHSSEPGARPLARRGLGHQTAARSAPIAGRRSRLSARAAFLAKKNCLQTLQMFLKPRRYANISHSRSCSWAYLAELSHRLEFVELKTIAGESQCCPAK
jgi:hypothetical protein